MRVMRRAVWPVLSTISAVNVPGGGELPERAGGIDGEIDELIADLETECREGRDDRGERYARGGLERIAVNIEDGGGVLDLEIDWVFALNGFEVIGGAERRNACADGGEAGEEVGAAEFGGSDGRVSGPDASAERSEVDLAG